MLSRRIVRSSIVCSLLALAACSNLHSAPGADASGEEFWSLRNATVAIARGDEAPPLTYFAREMTAARRAELAALAPRLEIVAGLPRAQALERAAQAQGADSFYATPEFLAAATELHWVAAHSAGVEHLLALPGLTERDELVLTNFRGVHGPAIADHVFALLLALTRDLPSSIVSGLPDGEGGLPRIALAGKTLLVVGLGGIGTEIARRGEGFGMRVIATRRGDDPAPAFVERVGKPAELSALVAEADVIAIAVPLTPETDGLFDRELLARCKRGAYLVNIARGRVVDTDALLEALESGQLAGAGLDVTDPEPLPAEHPLRHLPNVIVTPHVAADAELTAERGWLLHRENLRRFDAGEPLVNVVDKRAGY